jgi:hypothetical protein
MSQMATVPVFACRVCGKPVYVVHLSTTRPDSDAQELKRLMQNLSKIALCNYHRKQRNYYASLGREDEWLANALNPAAVILNVVDKSGVDYYGRETK